MPNRLGNLMDFAARYTDAWCSQDSLKVAAFFSEDGSQSINDGAPAVGRKAIAEQAQEFMTAFPDLRVAMEGVVLRGDLTEYRWTLSGTNTGPGGTGRKVRLSGIEIWKLDGDGLILSSKGRFDAAEYQRQLGL